MGSMPLTVRLGTVAYYMITSIAILYINHEQYYKSCLTVSVLSGATSTTESGTPARDREVVVSDTYV